LGNASDTPVWAGACEQLEGRTLFSVPGLVDQPGSITSAVSTSGSTAPIQLDAMIPQALGTGGAGGAAGSLIGLDRFRSDPRFTGIDGRGYSTVILDTGIDLSHPFFGPDADHNGVDDRIIYQYDFGDNDASAADVEGHGSNVASIIGSQDAANPGMAPGVSIIDLKVFKNSGAGDFGMIERALQWVVANVSKYNIVSVNMSLGDSGNYTTGQHLYGISDEFAALAAQNVIVVAAAGNSYSQFKAQGVSYPAADPSVVAVGAVYSSNAGGFSYGSGAVAYSTGPDRIAPFSQRSTALTPIFAPGAPITGADATGTTVTMHGTSQASPFIAGAAVLADQLAVKVLGRRLSLPEFTGLLSSTGTRILDGDDEKDNVPHTGAAFKRLDVMGLAQGILGMVAVPVNHAPTLTAIGTLSGATVARAMTIKYADLLTASNAKDVDGNAIAFRVQSVASGTLTKNGARAVAGSTTLGPGESLSWTPAGSVAGTRSAFSVVATDGKAASANPVMVSIKVAAAGRLDLEVNVIGAIYGPPKILTGLLDGSSASFIGSVWSSGTGDKGGHVRMDFVSGAAAGASTQGAVPASFAGPPAHLGLSVA
jgi:hypothetical protein